MGNYETSNLYTPNLVEVSRILNVSLLSMFSVVKVEVVNCPNLKEKPFMLASEGICGNPSLAEVGGGSYVFPLPTQDKIYNLRKISKQMNVPNALIIGASAGPIRHVECQNNCEMMANVKFGKNAFNNIHIARIKNESEYEVLRLKDSIEFSFLGNLFVSKGKPGKVIKVSAKHRKSEGSFVTVMRKGLAEHYKDAPVGVGGVFVIKRGKAKIHIMPAFPETPLNSDEEINNWFKYFNMSAPLSCLSTFISHDPGLDLRVEHSHCFSDHGAGGHYYQDTEPEVVEYEGYFNLAKSIFRFDRPDKD